MKLLDDADNTVSFDLDAEPPASTTDPVKTQLMEKDKFFEQFTLNQNASQKMVVGVEHDYCTTENISKTISGSLQLRILPLEQMPSSPPTVKLPLEVDVCYP